MYYVYILASRRHGTLYIGVTNSLSKRMEQHRNGEGSSFVKAYGVYRLVHVEAFERPDEAIAREKQLKRWKRDWKIELIEPGVARSQRSDCLRRSPLSRRPCERRDPYAAARVMGTLQDGFGSAIRSRCS
jgi:putative endonuclease